MRRRTIPPRPHRRRQRRARIGVGLLTAALGACSGRPAASAPSSPAARTGSAPSSPPPAVSTTPAGVAPAPTVAPPPAAPTLPVGAIGTPHPVLVEAVAADGGWIAYCQAREDSDADGEIRAGIGQDGALTGDAFARFVTLGDEERPIGELLASSPDGRWLVIRHGNEAQLLDARSSAATPLPADVTRSALPYVGHRFLSFDAAGHQLLYVRPESNGRQVVVRDLISEKERVLAPGSGRLQRARLDPTGHWVLLEMVVEDTDGNGRLELPIPAGPPGPRPCASPRPRMPVWPSRGDRPSWRGAPARGGKIRDLPGLLAPMGQRLLLRLPDDQLVLEDDRGRRRRFGTGQCHGHLIHADPARERALLACERTDPEQQPRNEVELWSAGGRRSLGLYVTGQAADAWPQAAPRWIPIYPGRDALLVDLETERTHPLRAGDRVLTVDGPHALVQRDRDLLLVDLAAPAERKLTRLPGPLLDLLRTPPLVVAGPWVIDVSRAELLGRVEGRPLAVARTGEVLVAVGGDGDATTLPIGPLAWQRPRSAR